MIADMGTMIWKEWKEVLLQRGSLRGGWTSVLIILALLGIFMPLQSGLEWLENPVLPLVWSWMPIFLTISLVADSFAGERERHTLETLLASRLSDRAILLGKMSAAVLYGWAMTVGGMLLGAITLNVAHPGEGLRFYPAGTFIVGVVFSLLVSILIAAAGVLVSLNAPTVRLAYQRLSLGIMALWLLPIVGLQFLPQAQKVALAARLDEMVPSLGALLPVLVLLLVLADVVLLLVTLARFRRARLILE